MKHLITLIAVALLAPSVGFAQSDIKTLDQLLDAVRQEGQRNSAENQERERRFREARDQQQALLNDAKAQLAAAERRTEELKNAFDANEAALEEAEELLRIRIGNFGELFGVVRQVAGDTQGVLKTSLVSAQYPDRGDVVSRLADTKGLPSIEDLRALQVLFLEEMAESGRVVRFPAEVLTAEGVTSQADVVRVGVFNVISGSDFLKFNDENGTLQVLARQPAGRFQSMAGDLFNASAGPVAMAVDPSRGSLLGLLIEAPGLGERIQQGGLVGYTIIAMGIIGLLIAIWRLLVLSRAGSAIKGQLKSDGASEGNALGRILKVYEDNRQVDTETLELKLDEAILKEVPSLERYQTIIKVIAAVAPLLGLLGTVVGMIITFQALTLFGTGDPKLMAGGISQALMTTVLGLVVAIPLVFLHSIVAGWSRSLVEILEEQSAGIIARHSESKG